MVWRFLKHYGMGKAGEVLDEFTSAVVAFDPDTASKAQIAMMQAELSKLAKRLAEAETEVRREHRETGNLRSTYDRYITAARTLQQKIGMADTDGDRAELEFSLAKLIDQLERLKPEIAREQQEDRDAEVWAAELRMSFEDLAAKLKTAESDLRSAKRRMETSQLQQQRAAERDQRNSSAAGLTTALSTISVALDAMNKETSRVRTESEALELKVKVLQGDRLEHDPHIRAALNDASPKQLVDGGSLNDRLAKLEDQPILLPASAA